MAREIRVTVDDDEVFERMKRRKRELDLSWREVLHRGLWGGDDSGRGRGHPGGPGDPLEDLGDRLERQIENRVEESIRAGFGAGGSRADPSPGPGGTSPGFEDEMETLANAEDAVLRFPFLEDRPEFRVPLRVAVETRSGGMAVDVVTVRTGKSVEGTNAFDRGTRKEVAAEFAGGALAVLELESGVEEYRVAPVLSWSRDDRGDPVVSDVAIDEVVFGDAE